MVKIYNIKINQRVMIKKQTKKTQNETTKTKKSNKNKFKKNLISKKKKK